LMCRNLHGRRLADVKEEQRLKKWVEKKAQREKEKADKEFGHIYIRLISENEFY
jgi:hypothetical protein